MTDRLDISLNKHKHSEKYAWFVKDFQSLGHSSHDFGAKMDLIHLVKKNLELLKSDVDNFLA